MGEFILAVEQFLLTYSPNIVSIIGIVSTFVIACRRMKDTSDSAININKDIYNKHHKEYSEQSDLIKELLNSNIELKEQNRELKELITRVKQNERQNQDSEKE